MAESGLTPDLASLRVLAIEQVLGGNPTAYASLAAHQQSLVDRLVNDALMLVYKPGPALNGRVHDWTFLKPTAELELNEAYATGTVEIVSGVVTLTGGTFPSWAAKGVLRVEGRDYDVDTRDNDTQVTLEDTSVAVSSGTAFSLHQDDYDLPESVGRVLGDLHFRQSDINWHPVIHVSRDRILELRQRNFSHSYNSGDPLYYAQVPLVNDPTAGTRQQLWFWPGITTGSVVKYRYEVRPDVLTDANKYPWGASDHGRLFKSAVLACCEEYNQEQRGRYWERFMSDLMASIAFDSRSNRPEYLGYNADRSDYIHGGGGMSRREWLQSTDVPHKGTGSL